MENIILSFNVIAPLFFLMVIGYVLVNYTGLADKELCQKANARVFDSYHCIKLHAKSLEAA